MPINDQDVELVAGRMRAWSDVLGRLADPLTCRGLLTVLDEGDDAGLHKFIDEWQLPGEPSCVEIIETITRFVHTGDYDPVETCTFAHKLRPTIPSTSNGKGYRMPDGTVLWLTEAEWWSMYDQAVNNEAYRKANHDLLVAVGIMFCTIELVPAVARFDIDKRYTICTPTWDPRARH